MKVAWWDQQWHSNEPKSSWGHRELLRKLTKAGVELRRVGSPRKVGLEPEDPFFAALRDPFAFGAEVRLAQVIDELCRDEGWGPGGLDAAFEALALALERLDAPAWNGYDATLILSNPIAFLNPKLKMVSAFARAALSGKPVAVIDNDLAAGSTLRYLDKLLGLSSRLTARAAGWRERFEVWAPHVEPVDPNVFQRFLFWPYDSEVQLDAAEDPDYDLGYVGNGWAANGPNYPHAELFFTPNAEQRYAVWGEWRVEARPERSGLTYHEGIPRSEVEQRYSRKCLASIFMLHGLKGKPHLTPRNNEVLQAGIPLFWDARIKPELVQRAPWLLPQLAVIDGADLSRQLAGLRRDSALRRTWVSCQRFQRINALGGQLGDWLGALENLVKKRGAEVSP